MSSPSSSISGTINRTQRLIIVGLLVAIAVVALSMISVTPSATPKIDGKEAASPAGAFSAAKTTAAVDSSSSASSPSSPSSTVEAEDGADISPADLRRRPTRTEAIPLNSVTAGARVTFAPAMASAAAAAIAISPTSIIPPSCDVESIYSAALQLADDTLAFTTSAAPSNVTGAKPVMAPELQPLSCRTWNLKGTEFGNVGPKHETIDTRTGKRVPVFFQGSPLMYSHKIPYPGPPAQNLEVKHMCQWDYVPKPPRHGTNAAGCLRAGVNNLVAVRFFDVFDTCKYAEAIRQSRNPTMTRRCLDKERERIRDSRILLQQQRRTCLLTEYQYLNNLWRHDNVSADPDFSRTAAAGVSAVTTTGAALSTASTSTSASTTSSAAIAAAAPRPKKKKSVPLAQRRRILVCAALRRNENPRMPKHEYTRPLDFYQDAIRSFLLVANPATDEFHILTNYYQPQWADFLEQLRQQEAARRKQLRAALGRSRIDKNDVAAPDGVFAARTVVQDSDSWAMQWDNWPSEPPLSGRVWKYRHLTSVVMADETDETVDMMIFSDARDVIYQINPFDDVNKLDLNRDMAPSRPASFRGVFAAAEDNSHQCNILRRDGTPHWEKHCVSSPVVERVMMNSRMLPDRNLVPIVCSGFFGGSMEAIRDFIELGLRTLHCHDRKNGWGVDQGCFNAQIYLGMAAVAFRHDFFLFNNPAISPVRHLHYFDYDSVVIHERTHTYVNCAGYPISVLHQLDRKVKRMDKWKALLYAKFGNSNAVAAAKNVTTNRSEVDELF